MSKFKKIIALALTLAMTMSVAVTAASAYSSETYTEYAPKCTMEVGENILSGSTAAANTTALSFLGINVTSTDVPGVLNAGGDTENPVNLLVFGSKANESPDPYLFNFYYNFNKDGGTYPNKSEDEDEGGDSNVDEDKNEDEEEDEKDIYEINSYSHWKGAYTLLNYAKQGPSGAATDERTIDIDVNGTLKDCNPLFFYEPDVLFGGNEGSYEVGLNYYKSNPDYANYNPLELYGWTRSNGGYAQSDGTFASTATMANGVYSMAKEIKEFYGNTKLSRYNNGDVVQCGSDYSSFALGVYYYVQCRLHPTNPLIGQIAEAGYCTGISISDTGVITVTNDNDSKIPDRYLQYMDGIAHQVETGKTYSSYGDLKKDVDLIIMDTDLLVGSQPFMINHVNIKTVNVDSIMPQTAYGTTMQSADNILGVPYFVGLLYEGRLSNNKESLSEYDYTAYFIKDLYHVNDADVETVLKTMIGDDGCGDAYNGYTGLTSGYEYYINQMIQIGAIYYHENNPDGGGWLAVDDGWPADDEEGIG